jgi:hypothetical protein
MPAYSKDGTKPRNAVEREIEIYRESLKIAKTFTPDDLEDMSLLRKVQGASAFQGAVTWHRQTVIYPAISPRITVLLPRL